MKAQSTITLFAITLSATLVSGILDIVLPGESGDRFLTAITFFGCMGSVISFIVAAVAAFRVDTQ